MRDRANWYTRTVVYFTLIMEAAVSFEMLVHVYQTKQRHILSPHSLFTIVCELNSNCNRIHSSL